MQENNNSNDGEYVIGKRIDDNNYGRRTVLKSLSAALFAGMIPDIGTAYKRQNNDGRRFIEMQLFFEPLPEFQYFHEYVWEMYSIHLSDKTVKFTNKRVLNASNGLDGEGPIFVKDMGEIHNSPSNLNSRTDRSVIVGKSGEHVSLTDSFTPPEININSITQNGVDIQFGTESMRIQKGDVSIGASEPRTVVGTPHGNGGEKLNEFQQRESDQGEKMSAPPEPIEAKVTPKLAVRDLGYVSIELTEVGGS